MKLAFLLYVAITTVLCSNLFSISSLSQFYQIQKGDTLYSVSRKFKIDPKDLAKWNGKDLKTPLQIGEKIHFKQLTSNGITDSKPKPHVAISTKPEVKPIPKLSSPLKERVEILTPFSKSPVFPHKGIEYAKGNGQDVFGAGDGDVVSVDEVEGYSKIVIVSHPGRYFTIYGNLENIQVKPGTRITKNSKLGSLGPSKGLYFQLNDHTSPIDPEEILQSR